MVLLCCGCLCVLCLFRCLDCVRCCCCFGVWCVGCCLGIADAVLVKFVMCGLLWFRCVLFIVCRWRLFAFALVSSCCVVCFISCRVVLFVCLRADVLLCLCVVDVYVCVSVCVLFVVVGCCALLRVLWLCLRFVLSVS